MVDDKVDYIAAAKKMNEEGYNVTPEYLEMIDNRTTEEWEQEG